MFPPNEASLCLLRAARLLRRHNIHSISTNPSTAEATPAAAMPATCCLVRTCLLLATAAADEVAAAVVVDERVCDAEVGVGKKDVVGARSIPFELE